MALKGKPGGGGGGNYSPTVTTANPIDISRFNANVGGSVSKSGGGGNTTEKGVCFSTSPNPTTANFKSIGNPGTGSGSFLSTLLGLSPNTLYYARAYATNGSATFYGNQVTFTTLTASFSYYGTVPDFDGNVYNAVTIGTQVWLVENLNTTHYRNGDPITHEPDLNWYDFNTEAYCNYGNDASNADTYGRLYNWYAVNDSRNIAPPGYHVATADDWTVLLAYFGGASVAASNLKEFGTQHWLSPNLAFANESGFNGLPGGYRSGPAFDQIGARGSWWSSNDYPGTNNAKYVRMQYYDANTMGSFGTGDALGWNDKHHGYSVRCVKD
jgi:uncharacterized protein (TIGR02145 family)